MELSESEDEDDPDEEDEADDDVEVLLAEPCSFAFAFCLSLVTEFGILRFLANIAYLIVFIEVKCQYSRPAWVLLLATRGSTIKCCRFTRPVWATIK